MIVNNLMDHPVVELLVLVRPDLGEPAGVDGDGVHLVGDASRYGVRRCLPVEGGSTVFTSEIELPDNPSCQRN